MAFTIRDYTDLVRLLAEHPEWRRELRQMILSDEFEELPAIVRRLAEAQQRTEAQVRQLAEAQQRTEAQVHQLAEAQQRTEAQVHQLAEAQQRTEEGLARLEAVVQKLAEAQMRAVERLDTIEERLERLIDKTGSMRGSLLELQYAEKAHAYWGFLMRRLKVMPVNALEDRLEAALTPGEFRDVFRLDVLASGLPRNRPDAPEVWLAIEVSSIVNVDDVDRAARRAGLLRKAGYRAVPVAAGESITRDAVNAARDQNVVLTQDGQVELWDEALSAWTTI